MEIGKIKKLHAKYSKENKWHHLSLKAFAQSELDIELNICDFCQCETGKGEDICNGCFNKQMYS